MAAGSKKSLLGVCYLLMASLFALSACFQFNDSDWYFWIPLYATACIVNLVNWAKANSRIRKMAKFGFWLGVFLFIKVSIEDYLHGTAGFWSLDMRERIVREKFGSGLVISSMFLLLENSSNTNHHPTLVTKYGMPILVGIAYGLSFLFFAFQHDEMRY
ncbi:hypothetical protein Pfo_019462 [Paulownia fortunei]|nr:hypothetical protein Pfo_019462 [Paulownia fortunei]